mgnify:CR=1 FL=1
MNFSDRLRELRGERTQKEMAALLGVKPNNYNGWENGKEPNVETMIKIADFHGVTLDYLTGRVDYRNPEYKELTVNTGLTEKAIRSIVDFRKKFSDEKLMNFLNALFETKELFALICIVYEHLNAEHLNAEHSVYQGDAYSQKIFLRGAEAMMEDYLYNIITRWRGLIK